MIKTILITGGAGFIGSNFVRYIFNNYSDYRILIVDALTYAGDIENMPVNVSEYQNDRLQFWYGNVVNAELVSALVAESDVVVHFAAETHVTRSIYDNHLFFQTDVIGTQNIANAVVKHAKKVKKFVHISTSEVYGTAVTELMDENHPLLPMSPYAAAKAGADRLVFSYHQTYGIPAVIIRPFNNYGPYQHLEKAIPRFITSCLLGEPIRVHGDGMSSRDFVYVTDTCAAIDSVVHAPSESVCGQVFNVASSVSRSILSVAQDVVLLMDCEGSCINFVGERPGQVFRHTGSNDRIKQILRWDPNVNWEDGLRTTIEWYRNNRKWWEKQLWMRTVPIITKSGSKELH